MSRGHEEGQGPRKAQFQRYSPGGLQAGEFGDVKFLVQNFPKGGDK